MQSDRGTYFASQVIQKLILSSGACQIFTSANMPQVNGQVESYNTILVQMLSNYVQDKPTKWLVYLSCVTFAYNNTVRDTTSFKPSYLLVGYEPLIMSDTFSIVSNTERNVLEKIKILETVR